MNGDRTKPGKYIAGNTSVSDAPVVIIENGQAVENIKPLAEEVPVALSYDGTTHAVMMASPQNLEDMAFGFSLTEGLITCPEEIESCEIISFDEGIDIQIGLTPLRREAFQKRRRHMAGPVGCGLCGIESIEAAMRNVPSVKTESRANYHQITDAARLIKEEQFLNSLTRATHAAAFYVPKTGKLIVREDIGRHNALDKLCGYLFKNRIDLADGMIVVTSRLSVEMVQKTAMLGASILVAISSPTSAAVKVGQAAKMTLVARTRDNIFEIYSGKQRIDQQQ